MKYWALDSESSQIGTLPDLLRIVFLSAPCACWPRALSLQAPAVHAARGRSSCKYLVKALDATPESNLLRLKGDAFSDLPALQKSNWRHLWEMVNAWAGENPNM